MKPESLSPICTSNFLHSLNLIGCPSGIDVSAPSARISVALSISCCGMQCFFSFVHLRSDSTFLTSSMIRVPRSAMHEIFLSVGATLPGDVLPAPSLSGLWSNPSPTCSVTMPLVSIPAFLCLLQSGVSQASITFVSTLFTRCFSPTVTDASATALASMPIMMGGYLASSLVPPTYFLCVDVHFPSISFSI